jgi:curved DNA-binding protein CbpA
MSSRRDPPHSAAHQPAERDDADLPPGLRDDVLVLEARGDELTHYELLGLPWGASAEAARDAYVALVKRYHPDRHGARRLGAFRPRLDAIVRRLTEARDTLCDDARRRAYEERTAPPEEVARRAARRIEDELRGDERRARLARTNPLVARAARVSGLVQRAKEHLAEGRAAAAANDLATVLALDPRHAEAQALVAEARRRADAERAAALYDEGLRAEAAGNDELARERLTAAAELAPADVRFTVAASRVALRLGRVDEARAHARSAVRAGPRHAPAFAALAAALLAGGDRAAARDAIERALTLDPSSAEVQALRKKARWSLFR